MRNHLCGGLCCGGHGAMSINCKTSLLADKSVLAEACPWCFKCTEELTQVYTGTVFQGGSQQSGEDGTGNTAQIRAYRQRMALTEQEIVKSALAYLRQRVDALKQSPPGDMS